MTFAHEMSLMMRRGEEGSDFVVKIISLNNWHSDRLRKNNWIVKVLATGILCPFPQLLLQFDCFAL